MENKHPDNPGRRIESIPSGQRAEFLARQIFRSDTGDFDYAEAHGLVSDWSEVAVRARTRFTRGLVESIGRRRISLNGLAAFCGACSRAGGSLAELEELTCDAMKAIDFLAPEIDPNPLPEPFKALFERGFLRLGNAGAVGAEIVDDPQGLLLDVVAERRHLDLVGEALGCVRALGDMNLLAVGLASGYFSVGQCVDAIDEPALRARAQRLAVDDGLAAAPRRHSPL